MKNCIYKIINNINGKIYIGSAKDSDKRKYTHFNLLKKNKHHSKKLQNAYNKYGKNNFKFIIIKSNVDDLLKQEQHYLDSLKPEYNISLSASAPMANRKHSKKSIIKMSGKIPWNRGIPRTKKERKLMSIRRKEAFKTMDPLVRDEWIKKLSSVVGHWKGKNIPKEQIMKMKNTLRKKFKKVYCLNNKKVYESQLLAAQKLKIRQGHISEVLLGKRFSASGYKFKYYENK